MCGQRTRAEFRPSVHDRAARDEPSGVSEPGGSAPYSTPDRQDTSAGRVPGRSAPAAADHTCESPNGYG